MNECSAWSWRPTSAWRLGTGYSSLSYLQTFPIDILKVDKSFVDGLEHQERDDGPSLIRAIQTLGTELGLCLIPEGIETRGQLKQPRALGYR